jgi:[ribosomal protein S18]-alanine N-acetyltransferase
VNYRLYEPGDFAQLYAIEETCFEPPLRFPRAYMRRLVNSPRTATWIAEGEDKLAGFAIVEWLQETAGQIAYIETIEVAAGFRKQGVGRELLRLVEQSSREAGAKAIWLHVDEENAPAIRLYEAHEYEPKGRVEGYYAGQRAALIYSKLLFAEP